ncbi:MAG: aspartyl protease family protein [Paludibacteraceae bacterium]
MKSKIIETVVITFALVSCITSKNEVRFEKDGSFYINATINDSIQGRFVFDTGADGLYMDSTFISQHSSIIKSKLDTARMRGAGATGYKQVLLVNDTVKVKAGNYIHKFTDSPILRLTDINGENIAGIIGNEFIKNQAIEIDNDKLTLKIHSVVHRAKYESIIPFDYIDGRIYFNVDIEIRKNEFVKAKLLMDLGCSDAIILNSPYFQSFEDKVILPEKVIDYTILYGGALGGNSNGGDFRSISIKLGDYNINDPIISFSKDTLGAFSKTNYDGLLGNEILDRYNYAIDYKNQKLYLKKNSKSKKSFNSTLTGFYALKTQENAIVMSIYYQSEAYKNGLQLGDTIIAINNRKLDSLTDKEFYKELKTKGKIVKLTTIRNQKHIDIIFKLNYLL